MVESRPPPDIEDAIRESAQQATTYGADPASVEVELAPWELAGLDRQRIEAELRQQALEAEDPEPADGEPGSGTNVVGSPSGPTLLEDLLVFRQATPEDINFIKKNWLRITRAYVGNEMDAERFYRKHDRLIGDLSKTDPCWIASDANYAFYIYGFICGYPRTDGSVCVHFVFTRDEWRGHGIAGRLMKKLGWKGGHAEITATHWSQFLRWGRLRGKNVVRDQYPLMLDERNAQRK